MAETTAKGCDASQHRSEPSTTTRQNPRRAGGRSADRTRESTDAPAPPSQPAQAQPDDTGSDALAVIMYESPSWLASLLVHAVVLLVLALWILPAPTELLDSSLRFSSDPGDEFEQPGQLDMPDEPEDTAQVDFTEVAPVAPLDQTATEMEFSGAFDLEASPTSVDVLDFGTEFGSLGPVAGEGSQGYALTGRGQGRRAAMVRRHTKAAGTEGAVQRALKWLAEHQNPNGSWSFDHRRGKCQGRCRNQGRLESAYNGATAIALLPFLGAGQTHIEGDYQDVVKKGLYFLTSSMRVDRNGGSFWEPGGRMYSHGLGAITLCEAYAMTEDTTLARPAQLSLDYIMYAQDPYGGGWRYKERTPGDTSVVGWQIMALKSGHMCYLKVQASTVKKAYFFLDSVQSDGGAAYGYTVPDRGRWATSAVGLLCRMYLGWKKDNQALQRGIKRLAQKGPIPTDAYYNYYATQAMFQFTGGEGEMWENWDKQMSNFLINTQAKQGHANGSWFTPGGHGPDQGGRLYCTAMATMILEVYYRHMPIYREQATTDEFPE